VLEIRDLWPDYMVEMGLLPGAASRRALFGLERWTLARSAHTVVVTESFRERVITKGVPRERTDVIPNGVELDLYYRADEPPPVPSLQRVGGEFLVGYLGTFGRGQDLPAVVRAAKLVGDADASIRFVLVGDGPDKPAVDEALRTSGATNVSVHPPIARGETRAFYNACDACLVPLAALRIFSETVPSKMFETMACERPIVASLAGEGAAIVTASGGGMVCEPGDAQSLAEAILRLRAMPDSARREMGARGRAYVTAHYSRAALADRYLGILSRLAANADGRSASRTR
jgi:glycosyltransferase involved in cell wall biosynthesis